MARVGTVRQEVESRLRLPTVAERVDFFTRAGAAADSRRMLLVTLPAAVVAPEVALELFGRLDRRQFGFLWAPPDGTAVVGGGAAARIEPRGRDRVGQLGRAVPALFSRLESISFPGWPGLEPRLFGGLAFTPGAADTGPWSGFGDGCFTLPRVAYARTGSAASLRLALEPEARSRAAVVAATEEVERLLVALEEAAAAQETVPLRVSAGPAPVPLADNEGSEDWYRRVEAIRRVIRLGRFEKIVAARRASYRLAEAPPIESVLALLAEAMPTCTRFAFLRERGCFFGATPERLISKRGRRIRTEALAGSHEGGGAEELLGSIKNRREHSSVVRHIVSALDPLCRELRWCDRPQIRELRNLLHLETPIDGELASDTPILELVGRLHPTPAVGGVPTREAMAWIETQEAAPRGWYAGPVGWLNAAGDGDFAVALRSAVLTGRYAHLWAGAGIVDDSDPEGELAETELKLRAVLGALGGEEGWRRPALAVGGPAPADSE